MAMIHQELNAVLLQRYRIWIVIRHALDHLHILYVELISAFGALICTHTAGHDDAGLLCELLDGLKDFGRHGFHMHHPLNESASVADDGEQQLAALTKVIKPAA